MKNRRILKTLTAVGAALLVVLSAVSFALPAHAMLGSAAPADTAEERYETVFPKLSNVTIFAEEDFLDTELEKATGAKVTRHAFSELQSGAFTGSEPADVIFFLTRRQDLLAEPAADGTVKYLTATALKNVAKAARAQYGEGTPILWVLLTSPEDEESPAELFTVIDKMESSFQVRPIHAGYTSYMKDGSDRADLVKRVVMQFKATGAYGFEESEEPAYNDIIYYVFENGNDKANGRTPQTAMKTCPAAVSAIRKAYGSLQKLPVGTRLIFEVSGSVLGTKSQAILGLAGTSRPEDVNGNKVPVIVETYQYNPVLDNRAQVRCEYPAISDPNGRTSCEALLTMKDIQYYSTTSSGSESGFACRHFWVANTTVTLDNVTFGTMNNTLWEITPSNNCWNATDDVEEGVLLNSTLILKNGFYGKATGIDYVAVLNTHYRSLTSKPGGGNGSLTEAYHMSNRIIVSEGAEVENLSVLASTLPMHHNELVIEKGGIVDDLAIIKPLSTVKEFTSPLIVTIDGGVVKNSITGFGDNSKYDGDLTVKIRNSRLFMTSLTEFNDSALLARPNTEFTGTVHYEIENCLIVGKSGLNMPNSLYLLGEGANFNGPAELSFINSTVLMLPNEKLTNKDANIIMGGRDGSYAKDITLKIDGTLFDASAMEDDTVYFLDDGGTAKFDRFTLAIGEDGQVSGKNLIYSKNVLLGGGNVQIGGEEKNGELSLSVRNLTITGDASILPVKEGLIGGTYSAAIADTTVGGTLSLLSGKVDGNAVISITGGSEGALEPGDPENVTGTLEATKDGQEIRFISEETEPATDAPGPSEPGAKDGDFRKYLPYVLIGAGVLAAAALVIILIAAGKKKKQQ